MAQKKAIVDKLLTNVSSGYIPEGYISEILLPGIQRKEKTGLLGGYGDSHLRIVPDLMGGEGKARRVRPITRTTQTYNIESHGLEGVVTQDDKDNVESPFDAEKDETIGVTTMVWLNKEKALADTLNDTAILTQNVTLAGTDQYTDYTNSDPLGDFKTARQTIFNSTGKRPDTAWMSWSVFNCLAYHPGILSALGFTDNRAGQLSEPELAKAMGVRRLLIADPQYNSAAEGQTDVRANVWADNVWFGVTPQRAEKYQTSLGYYVTQSGKPPRQVFKSNIDNPPNATRIIVMDNYDQFLTNTSAAYLIKAAI